LYNHKTEEDVMEKLTVVGLDLAKNIFQVHGIDERGHKLCGRKLKRSEVLAYFANLPPVRVGMETCCGAHEWARRLQDLGHEVKLMAPQHVKPYLQGNKTDARDAAAIAEAAARASVPEVAIRSIEGQQMQALHRARELWMKQRIALTNQMRGLLAEFGEIAPQGMKPLRQRVMEWMGRAGPELEVLRELIEQLMDGLRALEEKIGQLEAKIKRLHQDNPASRLIEGIPGVGLLSATAIVASFGRCERFGSARQFASCLGVTPREHSSGGKQMLLGVTKRGNKYLRKLLIHGARAVLKARQNKAGCFDDWAVKLARRRSPNIAAVALAAKNARRIWAMLRTGEVFRADHAQAQTACA
jgi:transposase